MVLSSANSVTHPYKSKDKLAGTIVTIQIFKKEETVTKLLEFSQPAHGCTTLMMPTVTAMRQRDRRDSLARLLRDSRARGDRDYRAGLNSGWGRGTGVIRSWLSRHHSISTDLFSAVLIVWALVDFHVQKREDLILHD